MKKNKQAAKFNRSQNLQAKLSESEIQRLDIKHNIAVIRNCHNTMHKYNYVITHLPDSSFQNKRPKWLQHVKDDTRLAGTPQL